MWRSRRNPSLNRAGQSAVASLVPAAQLFGVAFGPLMASFVVDGEEAARVPLVSVAFAILTVLALLKGHAGRHAQVPSA